MLLVDADPQGNATSGVGAVRDGEQATLYDVLLGGVEARAALAALLRAGRVGLFDGASVTAARAASPAAAGAYQHGHPGLITVLDLARALDPEGLANPGKYAQDSVVWSLPPPRCTVGAAYRHLAAALQREGAAPLVSTDLAPLRAAWQQPLDW